MKYYFKESLPLEEAHRLVRQNARDIIACGFHPRKTWIFSNLETVGGALYRNIVQIMKQTTGNTIHGINITTAAGTTVRFRETGFRERGWEAAVLEAHFNDHRQGWDFYLPRLADLASRLAATR